MIADLSIVIPVHNEEKNLRPLCERITASLARAGVTYEIIFVDDGSVDASLKILRGICQDDKRVKIAVL